MSETDRNDAVTTLISRLELLDRLCQSPAHVRDIVDETGQSRSTVHRAVKELTEPGFVRRSDNGIEATVTGRLARDQLRHYLEGLDDVLEANAVLEPITTNTRISPDVVIGSEEVIAAEPTPFLPADRIYEGLTQASGYRALLPTLEESRTIRVLYEHVVTRGHPAELVVSPAVFRTLQNEFPRRMTLLAEADHFTIFVGEVPTYTLGLLEHQSGADEQPTTVVQLVVHNDSGGVHGLLVNEATRAVSWATDQYEQHRQEATDRTSEVVADTDGGTSVAEDDGVAMLGQSLPVSLEREGFVHIDSSYFQNEPVAKPTTAWRAGLSPAEVHTGYAISRRAPGAADEMLAAEASGEDRSGLAAEITGELIDGKNAIVLGPPGSGKSTICKQVACRWYEDGRGAVFYRDGSHDRAVNSVEDLVTTATSMEGHTLIVFEDAVRSDTAPAVIEAVELLTPHSDVSILLDSREHEWRHFTAGPGVMTELAIRHVPPMREADCERLVTHFERTVGRTVDVPTERLWSAISDEAVAGEENGSHEMHRLMHRLATYADPLANDQTALEETVASVYNDLATDELALSVGILVNTLNAAGIRVVDGLLYAVGDVDTLEAVNEALERLHGKVLFPQDTGQYRTVHESWSTTFLEHLLEAEGAKRASERFGTVVSELLTLTDDPDRCERIATHLDEQWPLVGITDDPQQWVTATIEAVYAVGQQRSQLSPLFGDGTHDSIEFPATCSDATIAERPIWLGEMFLAGGYYDRAERAFERVSNATLRHTGERLLGLARVSLNRGEYDDGVDTCRECLSLLENEDQVAIRARARMRLGESLAEQGEYDDAKLHYETALDEFRTADRARWEARTLHRIGNVAFEQGAYERAESHYESSLETRQQLGDRRGEAEILNSMGNVAWKQGSADRAGELFEQSLEVKRALGDRHAVANALNNLGAVESRRGNYDRAGEFYEQSLDGSRKVGDRPGVAKCLHNLGHLEAHLGNYDRATELYEESLEIKQQLGDRRLESSTLTALGTVEGRRGNYGLALEYQEQVLELTKELGNRHGMAKCLHNIGQINNRRGNYTQAVEYYKRSLEIKADLDDRGDIVPSLTNLGLISARREAYDQAREYGDRALESATDVGIPEQVAGSYHCLGEVARRSGEYDQAAEQFERALEAVENEDGLVGLEIRLATARLAFDRGERDRARSIAREVRDLAEAAGTAYWRAQADQFLGQIEAESSAPAAARERYSSAFDYFREVDAIHHALETLELVVDTYDEGDEGIEREADQARNLLDDAPDEVAKRHDDWVSEMS